MLADNRLTRITGLIRGVGILVVFLIALAGVPQSGAGEAGCYDYTIFTCMNGDDCLLDAGDPCGEKLTGCAGTGYLACADMTGCGDPEESVAKVCLFESQH